jgi:TM2 domain-containing membrane protein YozV
MTRTPPIPTAFCRACGQSIDTRAAICPKCGVPQAVVGNPYGGRGNEAKSAGLAIFLSFLWPGAGHLYVGGDNEKGIIFTCISGLCFLISLTIIGLVLTVPVWFGTAIYTMIDSNRLAQARNAQA